MNQQKALGPFGLHVGLDYVRVLRSPDTHTDDVQAEVYGPEAERVGLLFSESPALLDALENLHDACELWQDQDDPVLGAARAVIAKVKGRS